MLDDHDLRRYEHDGYVVIRGVLTPAEVEEIRAACDELEGAAKTLTEDAFFGATFFALHRDINPFARDAQVTPPVPGRLRRVTYPYKFSATLDRYRVHPRILAAAAGVLGPDVVQIVNQVNFNPPGSASGWGWHQDYRFRKPGIPNPMTDFVQTLLALDTCSEWTGGLRVVPGSVKLGPLKLDVDNEHAEQQFDQSLAVTPAMAPGDLILFNSHLIHGSTANRSPHKRRVYINGYARATATIGMPVLLGGKAVPEHRGIMEYEGDTELLPKASKY